MPTLNPVFGYPGIIPFGNIIGQSCFQFSCLAGDGANKPANAPIAPEEIAVRIVGTPLSPVYVINAAPINRTGKAIGLWNRGCTDSFDFYIEPLCILYPLQVPKI